MIITTKMSGIMEHRLGVIRKALQAGASTAKEISAATGWNLRTTQRWLSKFVTDGRLRLTSEPTYRSVVSTTPTVTDNGAPTTDGRVVPTTPETVASTTECVTDKCRANDKTLYIDSYITVESPNHIHSESNNDVNQVRVVPAPLNEFSNFTETTSGNASEPTVADSEHSTDTPEGTCQCGFELRKCNKCQTKGLCWDCGKCTCGALYEVREYHHGGSVYRTAHLVTT